MLCARAVAGRARSAPQLASVRFPAELHETLPHLKQCAVNQLAVCLAASGVAQLGDVGVIAPDDAVGFRKFSGAAQRGLLSLLARPAGVAHAPHRHALLGEEGCASARARQVA